jgi:Na+-transporting NADH:ubiquinone oxidoreductase subunit NqrD
MNERLDSHFFWGYQSPLSALSYTALVLLASYRLAFALICTGTLVWVFGLSAFVFSMARPIMPERGKKVILLFLSSFLCGLFLIMISLLNPLLILGTAFFLFLIPPCCLGTGFFEAVGSTDPFEVVSRALIEAITLAGLILALSLIREPLGLGTLSLPGNPNGIIEISIVKDNHAFLPVQIFSVSGGGLLVLGYGTAVYRYFRERSGEKPRSGEAFEGD